MSLIPESFLDRRDARFIQIDDDRYAFRAEIGGPFMMKTLKQLYEEHRGKVSDKWSIYLSEYERLLAPYRGAPVNLLEIGIQNGGSLEIWSTYFEKARHLIGCDINPDCLRLEYADPRIVVVIGDANEARTKQVVLQHAERFDILIDDGSHKSGDIVKSFLCYFDSLNEGGIYIAEDLHCSYWQEFDGGLYSPYSSIAFFKRLADVINREHWAVDKSVEAILQGFFDEYHCEIPADMLASIHSVEFVNSLCVVRKLPAAQNLLGPRLIAGSEELVSHGLEGSRDQTGTEIMPSQRENMWSTMECSPAEAWQAQQELTRSLQDLTRSLQQRVAHFESQTAGLLQNVVRCETQIEGLRDDVAQRDHSLAGAREALDKYEVQIASLRSDVARRDASLSRLQGDLDALHGSTSWRLTAPLRWPVAKMHRLHHVMGIGMRIVRTSGGFGPAFTRAAKLLAEEGLAGLRGRLLGHGGDAAVAKRNDYERWVETYDRVGDGERTAIRQRIAAMRNQPFISIIMPTYNPKPEWLVMAIESVRSQLYPRWELCIADDCSSDPAVRLLLEKYRAQDPRIKVVFREQNGHISAASNSALETADGEWIALLDHDDVLPDHALYCVADAILENPQAKLFYSDEDKIDETGRRYDPYFKCDWNLDLFYSQNMFCHLGVYEKDLVDSIGGFRTGVEGAQDYDLVLRCTEQLSHDAIHHIPRVLYHWRAHAESTARGTDAKPYAAQAGERALNDHFVRQRIACRVEWSGNGYRAYYALPAELPLVSLIIPTRNGLELIRRCVESIVNKTTYPNYEILIVDNGSDDLATLQYLASLGAQTNIRVLRDDRPFNYSALNNAAVEQARGELIGLVNNDIEVISPDWLSEMVRLASQPSVGAVGARLLYPDDRLQHGGIVLGIGGVAGHANKYARSPYTNYFGRTALISSFSAVTAACLVVRKSIYLEVNGLNEKDLSIAFNDVDFCLRVLKAGYRNVCTPYADLYHYESATRGYEDDPAKRSRFLSEMGFMREKWGAFLSQDPFYSPNLTLDHEDFSLAWPPRVKPLAS